MNKKQLLMGILMISIGIGANACPIKVKNDTNVPVYVVTPEVADKLNDIATGQQIKKAAQEAKVKKSEYEKVHINETDMVGNGKSKTFYFYVRAGSSKQYIRLYQLQFTACIAQKQKKRFWRKNTIKISQLKKGELTERQQQHLKLTGLGKLFGYKFTKAYQELQERLFRFWSEQTPEGEPMIEDLK